ncbi:MAG: signal peptidase I [Chloroflexota bacterium]|nr:signal peptidase I [Chloroflexota bacterium]
MDEPEQSAEPPPEVTKRGKSGGWVRELIETVVLTAVIFLAVHAIVQSYLVDGRSMQPSLQPNERLFVNKAEYWRTGNGSPLASVALGPGVGTGERYLFTAPERGDVIVFHHPTQPGDDLIKRVIGLPGDEIRITGGKVVLNGKVLNEPYTGGARTEAYGLRGQTRWTVPQGELFVLGDNRTRSSDSRDWGMVPIDRVVGGAMFLYWPLSEVGGIPGTVLLPWVR